MCIYELRMNVSVKEHRALKNQIFDAVKFTVLTPLSLLSLWTFSLPVVGLKMPSFQNLN
jgi:hypothetical protein